ncbi:MAG: hypothetical protein R3282_00845 [Rhodothermales bacterium]|nr:hypothetical protein [Rhodothermales bacterium]
MRAIIATIVLLAVTPQRPAIAQDQLTCTIAVQAKWTVPKGKVGSIGLKSAIDDKASHIRVERGNWMLLDDHRYARVVRFSSDGKWEDRFKQCLECRDQVFRGKGKWRMREQVQPGCGYRRQYAFYLFLRDAQTTKIVDEKQIIYPGKDRYMRRGLQVIDLGDLGRFF